ncbi:DUF6804 family protein [Chryseobacterium wanjuense]
MIFLFSHLCLKIALIISIISDQDFKSKKMKPFLTFCAICCFVGIFRLPIEYYTFLRVLVSVGALIVIYNFLSHKEYNWSTIFIIILIIFNPVFPIYLYRKSLWIPIDTITGILFLLIAFAEKRKKKRR